jgi:hypothetical protein
MTTTHHITTTAALVLSLAAAAPVASARPVDSGGASAAKPPPAVYSVQDKSLVSSGNASSVLASVAKVSLPHHIAHVEAAKSGFEWGDAAIGAAGGIALSMLGFGGALGVSQHRTRRNTALTS